MKHFTLAIIFVGALLHSSIGFSQENSLDYDLHPWHNKAVMTCGMLRDMKTFDQQQMLSNLAELESELMPITKKYLANPPKEYAADPLLKTYFEDLADNIRIVRERVERKEYRLAKKYCGQCFMTFGKMHKTNGLVTLTDMLFSLRMEVINAQDMVNAGNTQGAKTQVSTLEKLYENCKHQLIQPNNAKLREIQKPLIDAYDQWVAAVNDGNGKKAERLFMTFMVEFPKLYAATL